MFGQKNYICMQTFLPCSRTSNFSKANHIFRELGHCPAALGLLDTSGKNDTTDLVRENKLEDSSCKQYQETCPHLSFEHRDKLCRLALILFW